MKRFAAVLVAGVALTALARTLAPAQEEKPKAQEEKPKNDPCLVAVGGLAASTMYFTFIVIGMTADSFEKGVYDGDRAKQVVGEVSASLKTNMEQIRAVRKMELSEADAKYIDDVIATMELIQGYGKHLSDYAKEKDPKLVEAFQKSRKEVWAKIKTLLGIK